MKTKTPRVLKSEDLAEYFEANKIEGKMAIVGTAGSNSKTYRVTFGKKGLNIPAEFFKQFFNEKADVRAGEEGTFIPILIVDKKELSKEINSILEKNKYVVAETE